MAICRWSDYQCDLYIYESSFGFECYVAAKRYEDEPEPPPLPAGDDNADWLSWQRLYQEYLKRLKACSLVPVALPHAGEAKVFQAYGELLDYVVELKSIGFLVPDWVIEDIKEENETSTSSGGQANPR